MALRSRGTRASRVFTKPEANALRGVLLLARERKDYQNLRSGLRLSDTEIGNLTGTKPAKGGGTKYRSEYPRDPVCLALYHWICQHPSPFLADSGGAEPSSVAGIRGWNKKIRSGIPDYESLFKYFDSIGAIDEEGARDISRALNGQFLGYRLSAKKGYVTKSKFYIRSYNTRAKTPNFDHRLEERSQGYSRIATGQVLEMAGTFVFIGFINSNGQHTGLKILALSKPMGVSYPGILKGVFFSRESEGAYEFGRIILVRVTETGKHVLDTYEAEKLFASEFEKSKGLKISDFTISIDDSAIAGALSTCLRVRL
jgi:hypothetical protein